MARWAIGHKEGREDAGEGFGGYGDSGSVEIVNRDQMGREAGGKVSGEGDCRREGLMERPASLTVLGSSKLGRCYREVAMGIVGRSRTSRIRDGGMVSITKPT